MMRDENTKRLFRFEFQRAFYSSIDTAETVPSVLPAAYIYVTNFLRLYLNIGIVQ
jgi:hypothetical protein